MNDTASLSDYYVLITVVLPVCLHLDSRTFYLPYRNGTHIEILTENFFSEKETYLGSGRNVEVESDEFSHFRFTRIRMRIPHFEKDPIDPATILERYKNTFFQALNTFIDSVRIVLKRYGLRNFYDYGEFFEPVIATSSEKLNPSGLHIASISFGKGPLTMAKPLRSEEEHSEIQELINRGISLPEAFLSDAKRELYYNNDIHALLNAVIALEIRLSDTVRNIATKKGVDEDSIEKFLVDVGLAGNIKTTLKLLVPNSCVLPSEGAFQKCKAAITIRNAIMHKGRREISHREVNDLMGSIESMIRFCETLINGG